MVTQQEAVNEYLSTKSQIDMICASLKNLEQIIEIKMGDLKQALLANRTIVEQCKFDKEKILLDHETRLRAQEGLLNKAIYFYSAITLFVGIVIGKFVFGS